MENGNMATQVSPVSEQEINMVHDIFRRLADTVVNASKASGDIVAIRGELESLKLDIEYLRNRNRELDAEVVEVRRQRDEAIRERDEIKDAHSQEARNSEHWISENNRLRRDLEQSQSDLVQARRDRDDYGLEAMDLRDKVAKFREWSDNLTKLLANVPVI